MGRRRMLRLKLSDRRPRQRPKMRFLDVVNKNIKLDGVREEDAEDMFRWKKLVVCGHKTKL